MAAAWLSGYAVFSFHPYFKPAFSEIYLLKRKRSCGIIRIRLLECFCRKIEKKIKRFVLCNGREISIFDVMEKDPLLSFRMGSAGVQEWESVYTLLSPMAFLKPEIFNYIPDFGVWCFRNGLEKVEQKFYNCYFSDMSRLSDSDFTITATIQRETDLLGSFDFSAVWLEEFMNQESKHLRARVYKYPFRYQTKSKEDSFPLTFTAFLSGEIQRNREEVYMPLRVARFI